MPHQIEIFIEVPTWLGDCVMATPAIESLINLYPNAKVTFFGSFASTSLFENHPNKVQIMIDNSKKSSFRALFIYKLARSIKSDIFVSFRSSFYTKLLNTFVKAEKKFYYKKSKSNKHQVLKYLDLILTNFDCKVQNEDLKLYFNPEQNSKKLLGLNPGATYGSAKRWYPEYFAKVAQEFANEFEIIIFGGNNEKDIANEIQKDLQKNGIKCKNLSGKTTIKQLCEFIASLDIFITNDSGPMHIAAAFKTPTIALFGPTKYNETSPWKNPKAILLHKDLQCMPCMKRVCPLKTHECMKTLLPKEVINAIKQNLI